MLWIIPVIICVILAILHFRSKMTIEDIQSKAVLISGCGSGFGRGLVQKCLEDGMVVFAGCRRMESVLSLEEEFKSTKGTLVAFKMDVALDDDVNKAKELVSKKLEELNTDLYGIVNNAGTTGRNFYDDFLTLDDYKESLNINYLGVIRVTHAFRRMVEKCKGRIIICTTGLCRFLSPGSGPYASSKCAAEAYCSTLRHELAPFGVHVIDILPGMFKTSMIDPEKLSLMIDDIWNRADDETKIKYTHKWVEQNKSSICHYSKHSIVSCNWVVNDYFHALTSKYPYPTYTPGYDSIFLYTPYSYLPVMIQIFCMRFFTWFIGVPVAVAA